jgi:methyl-accepting chemotaxis protein
VVGLGITIFLAYQLNIIYREQLRIRAVQASVAIQQLNTPTFNRLLDPKAVPDARAQLQQTSKELFKAFPEYEFLFLETHNPKIKIDGPFSLESRIKITPAENETIAVTMETFQDAGSGEFTFNGVNYMGAITNVYDSKQEKIGDIYVALTLASVTGSILNSLVPLLIGLAIVLLLAVVFATTFASRLVRPITAAADQANRISLGDLDRVVDIQSNDEIGDLLGSLERMRVSLKSVIGRLRRDR